MIYILFFCMGLLQDFMGASWVHNISTLSYKAALYAFLWAICNAAFVFILASSLDWYLAPVYAAGISSGSAIVIWNKKREIRKRKLVKSKLKKETTL